MGSTEDPKDGKGVAAAVFGAVVVYGVSLLLRDGDESGVGQAWEYALTMAKYRSSSSSAAARHYSTRDRQQAARLRCGRRTRECRAAFGKAKQSKRDMLHRRKGGGKISARRKAITGVFCKTVALLVRSFFLFVFSFLEINDT